MIKEIKFLGKLYRHFDEQILITKEMAGKIIRIRSVKYDDSLIVEMITLKEK